MHVAWFESSHLYQGSPRSVPLSFSSASLISRPRHQHPMLTQLRVSSPWKFLRGYTCVPQLSGLRKSGQLRVHKPENFESSRDSSNTSYTYRINLITNFILYASFASKDREKRSPPGSLEPRIVEGPRAARVMNNFIDQLARLYRQNNSIQC